MHYCSIGLYLGAHSLHADLTVRWRFLIPAIHLGEMD